ncbi:hypothetical protein DINM_006156 [Dirofilaria immitis]|nr:hypothetical protein [Dirofilaria immitis]
MCVFIVRCKLKLTPPVSHAPHTLTKVLFLTATTVSGSFIHEKRGSCPSTQLLGLMMSFNHRSLIHYHVPKLEILSNCEKQETEKINGERGEKNYLRQVCHDQEEIVDNGKYLTI